MLKNKQTINIPNFLLIGAAKCGTNSLFHNLNRHPDVFMSFPKEPFFFEDEYEKGLSYYRRRYFEGYAGQPVVGEARVANLLLPFVPPRIKESLPDARLVAILRNPVDRAYSHWWMKICGGHEKLSFDQAIKVNLQRLRSGANLEGDSGERLWRSCIKRDFPCLVDLRVYIDAGYYACQLKRYFSLFSSNQIQIFYFEDLCRTPHKVFKKLYSFLDLDPTIAPKKFSHENAAFSPAAIPFLILDRKLRISSRLPVNVLTFTKKFLSFFGKKPSMNSKTRQMLIKHYYPHNLELERLMGRSFSSWNRLWEKS